MIFIQKRARAAVVSRVIDFPRKDDAIPKSLSLLDALSLDKGIVCMASYRLCGSDGYGCSFFIKIDGLVCFYEFDRAASQFVLAGAISPDLPDEAVVDGVFSLIYEAAPDAKNIRIWSRD